MKIRTFLCAALIYLSPLHAQSGGFGGIPPQLTDPGAGGIGADGGPMFKPQSRAAPKDPYPKCGKAFNKKHYYDLNADELWYSLEQRVSDFTYDLDKDGLKDTLLMSSRNSLVPCDMTSPALEKRTILTIQYADGPRRDIEFVGGLTEKYKINYPLQGCLQFVGGNSDGKPWSKFVKVPPKDEAAYQEYLAGSMTCTK